MKNLITITCLFFLVSSCSDSPNWEEYDGEINECDPKVYSSCETGGITTGGIFLLQEDHHTLDESSFDNCSVPDEACSKGKTYTITSTDGLVFQAYQSHLKDSWTCIADSFPCSTGNDLTKFKIWKVNENLVSYKDLKILEYIEHQRPVMVRGAKAGNNRNPVSMWRQKTPVDYPYLIIGMWSGGASCCLRYEFYLKDNLYLKPFVIDYTRSDILFFRQALNLSIETYHPGSFFNNDIKTENLTNYLIRYFEEQDRS